MPYRTKHRVYMTPFMVLFRTRCWGSILNYLRVPYGTHFLGLHTILYRTLHTIQNPLRGFYIESLQVPCGTPSKGSICNPLKGLYMEPCKGSIWNPYKSSLWNPFIGFHMEPLRVPSVWQVSEPLKVPHRTFFIKSVAPVRV